MRATTDSEALNANEIIEERTRSWRSSNKSFLTHDKRQKAFLAIDTRYDDFLDKQRFASFVVLLECEHYDNNQVLEYCALNEITLCEALRELDTLRLRRDKLEEFQTRLNRLNGAPYGAIYAFAPTGVKAMAKELPDMIQTIKITNTDDGETAIAAAENYLREKAQGCIDHTPRGSTWLTDRSKTVQELYDAITREYKHHEPPFRPTIELRRD